MLLHVTLSTDLLRPCPLQAGALHAADVQCGSYRGWEGRAHRQDGDTVHGAAMHSLKLNKD